MDPRKLSLYAAIGVTAFMILFPPFTFLADGGARTEYGFILSGPPTIRMAIREASHLVGDGRFGMNSQQMMEGLVPHYRLDGFRFFIQLAITWGLYGAFRRTAPKTAALLIALSFCVHPAQAADLSYKTLFLTAMKLNPAYDFDAGADGYLQVFRPTVWQASHNDEFEFEAKRKDAVVEMRRVVSAMPVGEPIVIRTQALFGEYDFKAERFTFIPFNDNSRFSLEAPCCIQNNAAPPRFELRFTNPAFIDGLPMSPDKAHAFLDKRKSYGNIDRTLHVELTVVPKSVQGETEITGQIVRAVIRDPRSQEAEILSLPAPGT